MPKGDIEAPVDSNKGLPAIEDHVFQMNSLILLPQIYLKNKWTQQIICLAVKVKVLNHKRAVDKILTSNRILIKKLVKNLVTCTNYSLLLSRLQLMLVPQIHRASLGNSALRVSRLDKCLTVVSRAMEEDLHWLRQLVKLQMIVATPARCSLH